jgi:hypothetical protein
MVPPSIGQQTAYQVLVASGNKKRANGLGDLWDSRLSLMPPELTASLRRHELVNLLHCLTTLGKQQQIAP